MASRNERRRRSRQRAQEQVERSGADHDDIGGTAVRVTRRARDTGTTSLFQDDDGQPESISKAEGESRQPKKQAGQLWDPDKTIAPPIEPASLWSIYETNSIHAGCINAKVADSVGRGWQLASPDADTTDDTADVTRELTDALQAACTDLTFTQLVRQAVTELEAIGWSTWEILRQDAGNIESPIIGVLPMPAQYVRACKGNENVFGVRRGETVAYFKRFGYENQVSFKTGAVEGDPNSTDLSRTETAEIPEEERANEIILFKHYTPRSPWYGIPPWVSALPAIAEMSAMREFNVSYFESGGQADRLIHVSSQDEKVSAKLADKVIEQLEDNRGYAHTTIVTSSDDKTEVDVTPLEPKSTQTLGKESGFLSGKESDIEEIITAHGVPPYRLGIAKVNSLGGNVADSMDDDYRYGVIENLQEIMEAELRRTIFGEYGFADLLSEYEFEFQDRTPDDTQDEHTRLMDDSKAGVKSPNDVRRAKGEDPIEDPAMDEHYINGQQITNLASDTPTDPARLLAELKAALEAALGAQKPEDEPEGADGDLEQEEEIDPNDDDRAYGKSEGAPRARRGVFRGWKTLTRR